MKEREKKEPEYRTSLVIRCVTKVMVPFLLMFGLSVILHGHLTPGGGFQGGVIIGTTFILIGLAFNKEEGREAAPPDRSMIMGPLGICIYAVTGLIGILAGSNFLANRVIHFPPFGELGELFSGGTLFWINIGVGMAVSAVVMEMFYSFLEERRDSAYHKNVKVLDKKKRWSDDLS